MHEQAKIEEARFYLKQLPVVVNERQIFGYILSGFLSAARSALQYACKEAKTKTGGQAWYDGQVSARPVVKFLKDKRDINIHEKPIAPSARANVTAKDNISVSELVVVTIFRADGTIETREAASPPPSSPENKTETAVTYEYVFGDWSGNEDVIILFEKYLKEIEFIVADGVGKGFITP